ncbi:MAG TPA: DUF4019 domain-containing protein [Pyrinomonadaceae bacterium]|nr:DUF4019 domain-containing protein [Pyrinomonadaceae bacterium]
MRRRSRSFFVCSLLLLGVASGGCKFRVSRSDIPPGAQAALQEAIDDLDSGRYDKVYQDASDEWRSQSSAEDSRATLQRVRDKLGSARTRTRQTAREDQSSSGPVPGHSVTVIYQTTFDRSEAIETFTLIEQNGRWALAKYRVSSSEFL